MMWIWIIGIYAILALLAYSLCVVAGRADRRAGRE